MSDESKKRRLGFWIDVIFWAAVALVFIVLYYCGVLDFATYRVARSWF